MWYGIDSEFAVANARTLVQAWVRTVSGSGSRALQRGQRAEESSCISVACRAGKHS